MDFCLLYNNRIIISTDIYEFFELRRYFMKDAKSVRLYNVIFPVWLLFIFPISWLFVIPINFAIDSLIILLGMYVLRIENKLGFYKQTIFWVFLFGFLADILGGILLLVTQFVEDNGAFYEYVTYAVSMNPFDNVYSLLYTLFAVLVAGVLIYVFNRFISFRKIKELKVKRVISLLLAVLTAPYLFLLPTVTVYGGSTESFTNHIVWGEYIQAEVYLADNEEVDIMAVENGGHFDYGLVTELRDAVNTANKTNKSEIGDKAFSVVFFKNGPDANKMDRIDFFKSGDGYTFIWKGKYYFINGENGKRIDDAITDHLTPPPETDEITE